MYMLPTGQDNAITARELSLVLGIDARSVTESIQRMRCAGIPICATVDMTRPQGYFFPETEYEMKEYQKSLARRVANIIKTYNAVKRWTFAE